MSKRAKKAESTTDALLRTWLASSSVIAHSSRSGWRERAPVRGALPASEYSTERVRNFHISDSSASAAARSVCHLAVGLMKASTLESVVPVSVSTTI